MTEISYCDNISCIFNKNYLCTNPEGITLDENASCACAQYETEQSLSQVKKVKKAEKKDVSKFGKKDKWFGIV